MPSPTTIIACSCISLYFLTLTGGRHRAPWLPGCLRPFGPRGFRGRGVELYHGSIWSRRLLAVVSPILIADRPRHLLRRRISGSAVAISGSTVMTGSRMSMSDWRGCSRPAADDVAALVDEPCVGQALTWKSAVVCSPRSESTRMGMKSRLRVRSPSGLKSALDIGAVVAPVRINGGTSFSFQFSPRDAAVVGVPFDLVGGGEAARARRPTGAAEESAPARLHSSCLLTLKGRHGQ